MEISEQTERLPAIVVDIDGVVVKGRNAIGKAPQIIKSLIEPFSDRKLNIPFVLLTNGGGTLESEKADDINRRLGIQDESLDHKLGEKHMILCHTPLRDSELLEELKDQYVVITGYYDELKLAQNYGYSHAIHVEEIAAMYHDQAPNDLPLLGEALIKKYRTNLEKRFNKTIEEIDSELYVSAIFILFGVTFSSLTIQVLSDIIGSKTGHPKGARRTAEDKQTVRYISTNADLVWPNPWPTPRYGPKMFTISLQSVFKAYYGYEIEIIQYGKPETSTFDYCEKILRSKAKSQNVEITNFYMIGDTPESDIQGANRKGWNSILVRTGLFNGIENDEKYPAKFVMENLEDAIKMIYKLEGINKSID